MDTKGGFTKWLNKHSVEYKKAKEHRMLVIASKLDKNNFTVVCFNFYDSRSFFDFYQKK